MRWLHLTVCSQEKGTGTDIILALLHGLSTLWERAEGKRSQPPTTSQFPNYSKVCLPPCQTEAEVCMYVWEEGFLGMGIAIPPTKLYRTAVDQVCSYSAPRHPWEQSLKDPSLSYWFVFRHKGYCTEKENILFPITIIEKMRSNRSHLQQGSFGESILTATPRNYLDPLGRKT